MAAPSLARAKTHLVVIPISDETVNKAIALRQTAKNEPGRFYSGCHRVGNDSELVSRMWMISNGLLAYPLIFVLEDPNGLPEGPACPHLGSRGVSSFSHTTFNAPWTSLGAACFDMPDSSSISASLGPPRMKISPDVWIQVPWNPNSTRWSAFRQQEEVSMPNLSRFDSPSPISYTGTTSCCWRSMRSCFRKCYAAT